MLRSLKFIVMGYLCGSVLFARICAKLFNKPAILLESKDKNPGAANAFQYGGFLCGILSIHNLSGSYPKLIARITKPNEYKGLL